MGNRTTARLVLAATGALLALATAPAAQATLVFDRGTVTPSVWAANDDGSGAHRIGAGLLPHISPDGTLAVFQGRPKGRTYRPDLYVAPTDGSRPARLLAKGFPELFTFDWSPDGRTIVTVTGPELGPKRLALIDVATGAQRTLARGAFGGASFSPDGATVVYGRQIGGDYRRADVWRAPVAGGRPTRMTTDHRSTYPLWGPTGQIVFVKMVDAKRRKYGPKNELYLMNGADGSGVRRLTRTKVDPLLTGLVPAEWSSDGRRLLTEFGGQDTSYAVTVDVPGGAQRPVVKPGERGFVGADLTADGATVLGYLGGFEPDTRHDVATAPYGGGWPTVLVKNAANPDWNR